MDGRKDRKTDGQTLFYRYPPATAGGPKILRGNRAINMKTKLGFFYKCIYQYYIANKVTVTRN